MATKRKPVEPATEIVAPPADVNIVVSALNALSEAASSGSAWTPDVASLYQDAVQLAQKQAKALERIAGFEFASDAPPGPAHAALNAVRKIASDALGA
jgi:hypothetical protein